MLLVVVNERQVSDCVQCIRLHRCTLLQYQVLHQFTRRQVAAVQHNTS